MIALFIVLSSLVNLQAIFSLLLLDDSAVTNSDGMHLKVLTGAYEPPQRRMKLALSARDATIYHHIMIH